MKKDFERSVDQGELQMTAQLNERPWLILVLNLLAIVVGQVFPVAAEEKSAPEKLPLPTEITGTLSHVDALGDPLPAGAVMRLGSTRWRHGDQIQSVCYSQDGKRDASASLGDGSVRIWDAETGRMLHRFSLNQVIELALSEDGKWLAAIGRDPSNGDLGVWVWGEEDQKAPRLLTKTAEAICLRFHLNQLWVGEHTGLVCWYFLRAKQAFDYKFKTPTRVTALAIFPGTRLMIAAATSRGVLLIDDSGEKSVESPIARKECATAIAFSPDGQSVAVGTDDGALYLWSIKGKILEKRLDFRPHRVGVTSITFSADGKQLISVCHAGECYRWNALTGDKVSKVIAKGAPPVAADAAFTPALVLSPDGKRLAGRFAAEEGRVDHHLHVWDTANGEDRSLPFAGHGSAVWKMAFQSDGSFVSLSTAGELLRWNAKRGDVVGRKLIPSRENLNGVALSGDGRAAWFSEINGIEVSDLRTDARPLRFSQDGVRVHGAAFSPDPNLLVTAYDRSFGLWSVKQKSVTEVEVPGMRRASNLAFSADGKRLLVADKEVVLVWDVAAQKQISELKNVRSGGPIMPCPPTDRSRQSGPQQAGFVFSTPITARNFGRATSSGKLHTTWPLHRMVVASLWRQRMVFTSSRQSPAANCSIAWTVGRGRSGAWRSIVTGRCSQREASMGRSSFGMRLASCVAAWLGSTDVCRYHPSNAKSSGTTLPQPRRRPVTRLPVPCSTAARELSPSSAIASCRTRNASATRSNADS